MKSTSSSVLTALTVCAFINVTPAAAIGSDANGLREQAQIHPNEMNQDPNYTWDSVAEGEVYPPAVVSNGHFVRSRFANATALAPLASDCHMYRTDLYGGWWFTACGPQ